MRSSSDISDEKAALLERLRRAKERKFTLAATRGEISDQLYETTRCINLVEKHVNAHWHAQSRLNDELDSRTILVI